MGACLACCQGAGCRQYLQDLTPRSPSPQNHVTPVTMAFGRHRALGAFRHLEHDFANGASFHGLVRPPHRLETETGA
jgi:hypothetical protein